MYLKLSSPMTAVILRQSRRIFKDRFFAALRMTFLLLFMFLSSKIAFASGKIRIVATTATLADITGQITGDKADIYFVASPKRDIHFLSPTPKDVLKVKKADVFVHSGLDLELWRDPLLDASGRKDFMGNGENSIDPSQGITLLEVPAQLSRAEGDIHAFGNPHYWLDPANGKIIAANIAEGLARIYPEEANFFRANAGKFSQKLDLRLKEWEAALSGEDIPIVTYHQCWPYFANRFKLNVIGYVEPKPGIPPTPRHIANLVNLMREQKARIILSETYRESRAPRKLAKETGGMVLTLAAGVGEVKEASDYFALFDYNISEIKKALARQRE